MATRTASSIRTHTNEPRRRYVTMTTEIVTDEREGKPFHARTFEIDVIIDLDRDPDVTINWSALGEQTPEIAAAYANAITSAVQYAVIAKQLMRAGVDIDVATV